MFIIGVLLAIWATERLLDGPVALAVILVALLGQRGECLCSCEAGTHTLQYRFGASDEAGTHGLTRQASTKRIVRRFSLAVQHRLLSVKPLWNWLPVYMGAGDGAQTRRAACLEGRCSQKHRLLDTSSLYRLFEECFLVFALAGQKLLYASFAPIGKSFHLQATSGPHEVSSSARVYLIDYQKGMGQDKKTKTWTRVCFHEKKPTYVSSASSRDGRESPLGSHLRQQAPKKVGFTRNRTRATTRSNPFPQPKTHKKTTANDVRGLSCAAKSGEKIRPVGTISRDVMRRVIAL